MPYLISILVYYLVLMGIGFYASKRFQLQLMIICWPGAHWAPP